MSDSCNHYPESPLGPFGGFTPEFAARVHAARRAAAAATRTARQQEKAKTRPPASAKPRRTKRAPAPAAETPMPRTAREIIAEAAARERIAIRDVLGPSRRHGVVAKRDRIIAAVFLERPDVSLTWLGRAFGGRDHTTIRAALIRAGVYGNAGRGGRGR